MTDRLILLSVVEFIQTGLYAGRMARNIQEHKLCCVVPLFCFQTEPEHDGLPNVQSKRSQRQFRLLPSVVVSSFSVREYQLLTRGWELVNSTLRDVMELCTPTDVTSFFSQLLVLNNLPEALHCVEWNAKIGSRSSKTAPGGSVNFVISLIWVCFFPVKNVSLSGCGKFENHWT